MDFSAFEAVQGLVVASLFLGREVRPVVLLDGDDAGRARRDALMRELYAGYEKAVLMLSDVLEQEECETEFTGGERARGADGLGPAASARISVGGDRLGRVEDWVHVGDAAQVGASSRT